VGNNKGLIKMSKTSDRLQVNLAKKAQQTNTPISAFDNNIKLQIEAQKNKVLDIKLEQIQPNENHPRQDLETNIENLKESIEQEGLLQPIILAKTKDNKYIIVAGHRRFKAHQLLNKDTIKAIIHHETYTPDQLDEKALIENLQRENLSKTEIAETLFKLNKDKSFNVEKISKLTGYKRSQIFDYIRCQKAIINNEITKDQLLKFGLKNCIERLKKGDSPDSGLQGKNSQSKLKEAQKKSKSFFRIVIKDVQNKDEIEKAIKSSKNQLLELQKMLNRIKKNKC
jgi:ParB/RepB/Spo0J family partition protein